MVKANHVIKDFKAPQTLGKDSLYVNWKKEIKIWEAFTSRKIKNVTLLCSWYWQEKLGKQY